MTSVYQGDPLLSVTGGGMSITFTGGQPKLEKGLVNAVMLSLFHSPWFVNSIISDSSKHIGSEFLTFLVNNPITVANLNSARNIALNSLNWLIANNVVSEVDVRIKNPNGTVLQILVLLKPPGKTIITILATKYGLNWKFQLNEVKA